MGNLEEAAKFYEEILGLKRGWTDKKEQMIVFLFPDTNSEIVIHRDETLPNPDITYQVDNIEEFCQYYRNQGCKIGLEPIEVRCGKLAILIDPDGNKLPIIVLTKFNVQARYD